MKIIIEGTSKEIAALVLELQERRISDTCVTAPNMAVEQLLCGGCLGIKLCEKNTLECK